MSITDNVSPISRLPDEVMLEIFSKLDSTALLNCAAVSTAWRALAHDRSPHSDPHFYRLYTAHVVLVAKEAQLKAEREGRVYREIGDRTPNSITDLLFSSIRPNPEFDERSENLKKEREALVQEIRLYKLMRRLFGDYCKFEQLPVLDIGEREGDTGYIDFIRPAEMTASVMRGKEKYGRIFIVLRAIFTPRNPSGTEEFSAQALTYFQRYSNTLSVWVPAGSLSFQPSFEGAPCFKSVQQLLTSGSLETTSSHFEGLIGSRIEGVYKLA